VICVLQFDAASVAVLDRLLAAGRLPSLAGLIDRGRRVELETPAADFAAGAFYTLYSGVELADHGIFYPFQWKAAEQRARYATAFEAPPPVWERLAESGLRTLAIDPYESRPPSRDVDGGLVCGWGFTDRVVLPRWSVPAGLGRRLARRHGRAPAATEVFGAPRASELIALRGKLVAAPGRIATLAEELLARERFDLAWLTFSAAHLAGHQFWDLSQLDPETLDSEDRRQLESALDDVSVAVDEAFGRVLAALPAGADVVVTSAVGMDVNTSRADLLPEMLERVLAGARGDAEEDGGGGGAIWRLRAAVPPGVRARIANLIPRRVALELTARLELRGHDWSSTEAFAHPADNQGYVRLNLRGRERDGIVEPAQADALIDRIAEGLTSFHDPDGEPAVEAVVRAADLYPGTHLDRLPDLVVRWAARPATTLRELRSERYGVVRRRGAGSGRSGNHTPGDAWAVLAPAAAEIAVGDRRPRLVDVAATVCELTGADAAGLPGTPLMRRA
jgi:predicted AlkP superfamily phosphohydrolase/phosphomutase